MLKSTKQHHADVELIELSCYKRLTSIWWCNIEYNEEISSVNEQMHSLCLVAKISFATIWKLGVNWPSELKKKKRFLNQTENGSKQSFCFLDIEILRNYMRMINCICIIPMQTFPMHQTLGFEENLNFWKLFLEPKMRLVQTPFFLLHFWIKLFEHTWVRMYDIWNFQR